MRREDLGSLTMFLAVAEERSFTRAARRLDVSQSALSHAMRRLEARLGLRLLTRTTRSVAPTVAGERLIETLRPAFDEIENKLASLTELRERPAGTIRITTSKHAAYTILWPVIARLTAENPDIQVELSIDAGLTDIVAERFDAGVRLGERLEKDMIAVRIGPKLRMAAAASPDYLARHGVPRTPGDLAHHVCINLRFVTAGSLYVWEFEKDGRELKVKVEGQLVLNDVDLAVEDDGRREWRVGLVEVAVHGNDAFDDGFLARGQGHDFVARPDSAGGDGAAEAAEVQVRTVNVLDWKAEVDKVAVRRDMHVLEDVHERAAVVPGRVLGGVDDVVTVERGQRHELYIGQLELAGELSVVGLNLLIARFAKVDKVHLVDGDDDMLDA